MIEAPSKDFDNSESTPAQDEATSQEESMLSSDNKSMRKLRLYTICEEAGSSVSESNDLLSMSDRIDSKNQNQSILSRKHMVGKSGI